MPGEKPANLCGRAEMNDFVKKGLKRATLLALCALWLSGCGCAHREWSAASCTEPSRCLECGKADGLPLGHDWLAADCTTPETCALCGSTKGEAKGHSWSEATEQEPKTCKKCGLTEGEPLSAEMEKPTWEQVYSQVCEYVSGETGELGADFSYEGDIFYVRITAPDGTAVKTVSQPELLADDWAEYSELFRTLSAQAQELFSQAGFDLDCWVMLLNDVNSEKILLAACDGSIRYDISNN